MIAGTVIILCCGTDCSDAAFSCTLKDFTSLTIYSHLPLCCAIFLMHRYTSDINPIDTPRSIASVSNIEIDELCTTVSPAASCIVS